MTLFEFVSVMFSIILGLSLSHILAGLARLVRDSRDTSTFGPLTLWITTLVFMHFLLWWSIWDFRDVAWNFPTFVFASSEPLFLFFMTALLLPTSEGAGTVDLRAHFFRIRRWLMTLYAALMVIYVLDGPLVFRSESLWSAYRIPQLAGLLAAFLGLTTEDARHHWFISLVVLSVVLSGTAFRFFPAAFTP